MIRSILLVEDLPFTRTMTRRILSAVGWEDVVEAADGTEAIELLGQVNEIDVILADISMPGISGLQLLEMIRGGKTPAARDIPFIVIFGTVDDTIYNDLKELDATAITLKPVRKDDLSETLKRIEADLEADGPHPRPATVKFEADELNHFSERTFASLTSQYHFDDLADRIRFLETVPDFEGLDVDSLRQLAERTSVLQVPERAEIDVSEFSGNRLLLIVTGEIELLQMGQFSRVGSQEHRTTLLEAGNLVGISSFITLPGEGGAIQVRTTRATELFSFDFTSSESNPEVKLLRDNVRLSVGRTLAHRLNFSGKSLVDNLTERLAETNIKRTAGSFVIMMVAMLAIYTLIVSTLLDLDPKGPIRSLTSVIMILLMLVPFLITIRKSPFQFSELGLTLKGWKIAVVEAVIFSSIFLMFLTGLKFLIVSGVPEYQDNTIFELSKDFVRRNSGGDLDLQFYLISMGIYALFVPVQEIIARCGLQSLIRESLYGSDRYRTGISIFVSNLIFAAAYAHLNVGIAVATFFGGVFWGWLFHRRRSIVGVSVSHIMIGGAALFALGLETFLN